MTKTYRPLTGWLAERSGTGNAPTEKLGGEPEPIKLGQWYWVKKTDERTKQYGDHWLGCVMKIGSNYVKLEAPDGVNTRIHMEHFDERCERELNAPDIIDEKVSEHKQVAARLLDEIKQLTSSLGIGPREVLAEQGDSTTALAVAHDITDIKAHQTALVKAQKETLPELFQKVEDEHKAMAKWMKGQLLPALADLGAMKKSTESIGDRIFTVELYAGLIEQMVQIVDGAPASIDDKVNLFQRRHYMDEECLANYEAGGMDIRSIEKFDAWLSRPDNFKRVLPMPRCIVAFQVRRHEKDRPAYSISDFIKAMHMANADKTTFLYIRNGEQLFRLTTGVDFGEQLFPDREHSELMRAGNLYIGCSDNVISQREYDALVDEYKCARAELAARLWAWKHEGKSKIRPYKWLRNEAAEYEPATPDSVRFDDGMAKVAKTARDHNRVAVVLQGLLDRSPAMHPHPPWRLWTSEGFTSGIELVYDTTRGLTDGPPPDFEAYRDKLNASLTRGSMTVGQEDAWMRHEAEKENKRRRNNSVGGYHEVERHKPYGDPGPGLISPVIKIGRNSACTFAWERDRTSWKTKWVNDPDRPGYRKPDNSKLPRKFSCSSSELLNVSAYKAGDYKIFYADPRTRSDYLEWAPLLLAAEDYVNRKGEMFRTDRPIDLGTDDENDRASDQDEEIVDADDE